MEGDGGRGRERVRVGERESEIYRTVSVFKRATEAVRASYKSSKSDLSVQSLV